ncbi:hypothetical protein LQW54_008867 [Pestalotiopsis sp. IQ-011]
MFHDPLRTTVSDHQGLDPLEMLLRLDAAQKEVQSGNELQLTLQRLLIDFGVTVSSDPRDSIYAFLSLANDIDISNWAPDYSQINPPLNLFIKALAQIVDRTGSIDAICRHRSWSHPSIPNSVRRSLTSVNGRSLEAVARQLFQRVPGDVLGQYSMPQHFHIGIGFSGFIVDKIRAVGVESPSAMPHSVNNPKDSVGPNFSAHPDINLQQWATLRPQIPIRDWAKLPGMKELTLDENGMPGRMFYRALTGNRRILDKKIGHLTDEMVEQARVYYNSEEPEKQCAWNVHESVEVMLQNKRKFATTNTSLGFVPTDAQVGDSIAILEGCSVPVVIRKGHHRPRPDFVTWQLIGECYIEGLMEGEFIEKLASQDEVWSEKLTII